MIRPGIRVTGVVGRRTSQSVGSPVAGGGAGDVGMAMAMATAVTPVATAVRDGGPVVKVRMLRSWRCNVKKSNL